MKRVALSLFGIALMVCSTGCCLLGGSHCGGSPCGPCGGGGAAYYGGGGGCSNGQCGAGAAFPQGAFYDGGSAAPTTAFANPGYGVTQTAMVPVEALNTY